MRGHGRQIKQCQIKTWVNRTDLLQKRTCAAADIHQMFDTLQADRLQCIIGNQQLALRHQVRIGFRDLRLYFAAKHIGPEPRQLRRRLSAKERNRIGQIAIQYIMVTDHLLQPRHTGQRRTTPRQSVPVPALALDQTQRDGGLHQHNHARFRHTAGGSKRAQCHRPRQQLGRNIKLNQRH